MEDQADFLRQLVQQRLHHPHLSTPRPYLAVVSGSKGGVGTTTVAVSLAAGLAEQGLRVVLVDADLGGPNVDVLCHLEERDSILDILSSHRTVHEVLQLGPAGVLVIPGRWAAGSMTECSATAQQKLIQQLFELGPHADLIVIDAGSGLNPKLTRFAEAADALLICSTPDQMAVMDAYAVIKAFLTEKQPPWLGVVFNQVKNTTEGEQTLQRLTACCHRFLGCGLDYSTWIPQDAQVPAAAQLGTPFLLESPTSSASQALQLMVSILAACPRRSVPKSFRKAA